jgi:hypothetical protein
MIAPERGVASNLGYRQQRAAVVEAPAPNPMLAGIFRSARRHPI